MFGLSVPKLLMILGIVLVIFGPSRLPEIGKAIGKTIQGFRGAMNGEGEQK